MQRLSVRMGKVMIAFHMRGHGYDADQRKRLINKIGDGRIWEIIKKYGPIVLAIFVKYILPFLLALELPKLPPIENYWLDDGEDMLHATEIPGDDSKDETELE